MVYVILRVMMDINGFEEEKEKKKMHIYHQMIFLKLQY